MQLNNYWKEVRPKYKLIKFLEQGHNGEIVIGQNRDTQQLVAIKHLNINQDPSNNNRVLRELTILR